MSEVSGRGNCCSDFSPQHWPQLFHGNHVVQRIWQWYNRNTRSLILFSVIYFHLFLSLSLYMYICVSSLVYWCSFRFLSSLVKLMCASCIFTLILICNYMIPDDMALLGELQFTFVCFLIGHGMYITCTHHTIIWLVMVYIMYITCTHILSFDSFVYVIYAIERPQTRS